MIQLFWFQVPAINAMVHAMSLEIHKYHQLSIFSDSNGTQSADDDTVEILIITVMT